MMAGARSRSSREVKAENRRYLDREVERRVQEQLRSGSRTGSSQQQRAGARGRSSREVDAEKRRYLDREVERRVKEQLQREKDLWEQETRQERRAWYTRKERAPWSGSRENGESQRWQRSRSGNRGGPPAVAGMWEFWRTRKRGEERGGAPTTIHGNSWRGS